MVKKASRGNRDALIALCRTIARDVLFRVSYRLSNRTDAEDVAQEVLIRVCTKIGELKDPKAFGAWLHSIIMNETNTHLTTTSRRAAVLDIDDFLDIAEEENDEFLPYEYTLRREDRVAVMESIRNLPQRQQEAILLHYFEYMSVSETAVAMGVTQPCASRYLALARENIKSTLVGQADRSDGEHTAHKGLAALPIGPLVAQTLQQESLSMAASNEVWLEQTTKKCILAAKGAGKDVAALASTTSFGLLRAVVIAFLLLAAAVFGVWLAEGMLAKGDPTPPAAYDITGTIAFSGGISDGDAYAYVNPLHATVNIKGNAGELAVSGWKVVSIDDATNEGATLYSGSSPHADEALAQLLDNGKDGTYQLVFTLKDSQG
ncbi:MAG: sigma-70 family RNA polymerase sigma factor, partial [Eggerthellaceae bacterium]|nr:sigma-70 family RNA polymerase sigma factor [Eggerthellaceae bacterium]